MVVIDCKVEICYIRELIVHSQLKYCMFFLFIITYIITGAPTSGVIALRGNILLLPGSTVSILHNSATQEPAKIVTGNNIL